MFALCALYSICFNALGAAASQIPFTLRDSLPSLTQWTLVGPFETGTRSYPLDAARWECFSKTCRSSLTANGTALSYKTAAKNGTVSITFPAVNWGYLRNIKGWAALQYEAYAFSSFQASETSTVCVHFSGAVAGIIQSQTDKQYLHDDLLGHSSAPPGAQAFCQPVHLNTGSYNISIRYVRDFRSQGDPGKDHLPDGSFTFQFLEPHKSLHVAGAALLPEILPSDKLASKYGSIRLRAGENWTTIDHIFSAHPLFKVKLLNRTTIAPWQTRDIAFAIERLSGADELNMHIAYTEGTLKRSLEYNSTVKHTKEDRALRYIFLDQDHSVQYAMAHPPRSACEDPHHPAPILVALHGAGVEASYDVWTSSVPAQDAGVWTVFPTGKSTWGQDWHASSAKNVFRAIEGLSDLHNRYYTDTPSQCRPNLKQLILAGHSNGGQGVWYFASRYPSLVLAAVPASAYLSVASYIPSASPYEAIVDPFISYIDAASLLQHDNALHASNLAGLRIRAIHGELDSNVPVFHTRRMISLIESWSTNMTAEMIEVPGTDHVFADWFTSYAQDYVNDVVQQSRQSNFVMDHSCEKGFTLTVGNPEEQGPKCGIRVVEVDMPGRLARIAVQVVDGITKIRTNNVAVLTIAGTSREQKLEVDGIKHTFTNTTTIRRRSAVWQEEVTSSHRRFGSIFDSIGPVNVVYSSKPSTLTQAVQVAQASLMNLGTNVNVISDGAAVRLREIGELKGNTILVDLNGSNTLANRWLVKSAIPITMPRYGGYIINEERYFGGRNTGVYTMMPHPSDMGALALLFSGTDEAGLQRALQLLPVRTGVPFPDWMVLPARVEERASGFYKNDWSWNAEMSFLP